MNFNFYPELIEKIFAKCNRCKRKIPEWLMN